MKTRIPAVWRLGTLATALAALAFSCITIRNKKVFAQSELSPQETRAIAKEAYIYGFPLAVNYRTMYNQAIDQAGREFRAPFNVVGHSLGVATPSDKFVVTPNSDTPYSFLWMDLRAEPIVITMPKIDKNRYYSAQLIDLYTYNFGYLGTRSWGNDGGKFMVVGPHWKGETPDGVRAGYRSDTEFAYALFRTQLFDAKDWNNVQKIQDGYGAQTLSQYLSVPAPAVPAKVDWIKPTENMTETPEIFRFVNFVLQFCPPLPSEQAMMARFAKLNIGHGKTFDYTQFSPAQRQAMQQGIDDANKDFESTLKEVDAGSISTSQFFGSREEMKNNYLYRFVGAKQGLYGNSAREATYYGYFDDSKGKPLDAAHMNYTLHFAKGHYPPANAFWSVTMYDAQSKQLVENPLRRYVINSSMMKSLATAGDGSLTIYVQKNSPGPGREVNWLPAPDGPFYLVLRLYLPEHNVVDGSWKKPQIHAVPPAG